VAYSYRGTVGANLDFALSRAGGTWRSSTARFPRLAASAAAVSTVIAPAVPTAIATAVAIAAAVPATATSAIPPAVPAAVSTTIAATVALCGGLNGCETRATIQEGNAVGGKQRR